MSYKNQNYMTNKLIKSEVDKNQKKPIDPIKIDLSLTVLDKDEQPIELASVTIDGTLVDHKTNDQGKVTITNLENKQSIVVISKKGYKDESIVLELNKKTQEYTITLEDDVLYYKAYDRMNTSHLVFNGTFKVTDVTHDNYTQIQILTNNSQLEEILTAVYVETIGITSPDGVTLYDVYEAIADIPDNPRPYVIQISKTAFE